MRVSAPDDKDEAQHAVEQIEHVGRGKHTYIYIGGSWRSCALSAGEEARGRGATRDEVRAVTVFPAAS
jgi:hypothetical protein